MISFEQWQEVADNALTRKDLLKSVSFQDLLDLLSESVTAYKTATDALKAARQAFIDDCKQRDQAIDQERENLQKEVSDQETRIRACSAQYQKALGSGKVSAIPDLKKQIAAATAARDEAQSTLSALEGVQVEYNRKLYEKAENLREPVHTAKAQLQEVKYQIDKMRDVLENLFDYDSDEYRVIRNAGESWDLGRYDPQNWSEWSRKFSGIPQPVSSAARDPEPMRPI